MVGAPADHAQAWRGVERQLNQVLVYGVILVDDDSRLGTIRRAATALHQTNRWLLVAYLDSHVIQGCMSLALFHDLHLWLPFTIIEGTTHAGPVRTQHGLVRHGRLVTRREAVIAGRVAGTPEANGDLLIASSVDGATATAPKPDARASDGLGTAHDCARADSASVEE